MKREARFWEKKENNKVQCNLCPHRCIIPDGKRGICKVRENDGGKLFTLIYGSASSIAMEPIEKKPLYHFYPNSCVFLWEPWGAICSVSTVRITQYHL